MKSTDGENPVSIFISMWPPLLWCELFIKRRDSICVAFCPLVTLSLQNSLSEYVCRVSVTLFLQNIYNISYGAIGHTVWHKQPRAASAVTDSTTDSLPVTCSISNDGLLEPTV